MNRKCEVCGETKPESEFTIFRAQTRSMAGIMNIGGLKTFCNRCYNKIKKATKK